MKNILFIGGVLLVGIGYLLGGSNTTPTPQNTQSLVGSQQTTQVEEKATSPTVTEKVEAVDKKVPEQNEKVITTPASCSYGYYRNVDGNCVHVPSEDPEGATAKCRDGTYSYSQNRRGTCSHHGGVATWL
jgi:hypothetical protein